MAVAHVAFDFGFGHEGGYGVNNDHVHAARAYQRVADFQSLLTGVGLGEVEFFYFNAEFAGVNRVEGVFGVDESTDAAVFLALGNGFKTERGFTGRFRAEDFHDTTARQTTDAECQVKAERAGGDDVKVFFLLAAVHFHDGTFAEVFFNLGKGGG